MFNHRIRIFSSILVAFIFVIIYGRISTTPFISPIKAENIKNLLSNLKFNPNSLVKFLTLNFDFSDENQLKPLTKYNQDVNFESVPIEPTVPIQPITDLIDLTDSTDPTDSTELVQPSPTKTPTKTPTPTPKPTKVPKPTATPKPPPITSNLRPGTNLQEIFEDVGERSCFPAALLHAFQTQESGPFYNFNNGASITKIYNTYGWWKTGAGNPCFGLGYHTQTGIVPSDSVMAGYHCQNAIPSGADQAIMGILQISQFEQDRTLKYTSPILPNGVDRRVLFDNTLIFAYATRARIGTPPKDCNNWPDSVVKIAAEKHYGACTDNYCENILKYYKQYK